MDSYGLKTLPYESMVRMSYLRIERLLRFLPILFLVSSFPPFCIVSWHSTSVHFKSTSDTKLYSGAAFLRPRNVVYEYKYKKLKFPYTYNIGLRSMSKQNKKKEQTQVEKKYALDYEYAVMEEHRKRPNTVVLHWNDIRN